MPYLPNNFGLLEADASDYETSRVAVLPVPFERTTSYGKGTTAGPAAILRASQAMELYDEELGGEHSLSQAPVKAARQAFGEIGVVQFDAHTDLREEFEGTPYSHASVMKRIVDEGIPTLAVGIRSLSAPEASLVRERCLPVIWGHQLDRAEELFPAMLAAMPEKIYLTFDIDFFDPSLVPATGTPEPGGGHWYPTLRLLRHLFQTKTVVSMDLIELAPVGGHPASDFLAAKLIYKCLGYLWEKEGRGT